MHEGFVDGTQFGERRQQTFNLGSECKPPHIVDKIKRFDPKTIARQKDDAGLPIVNGKGPHAIEPADAVWSPHLVGVEKHLSVAIRTKDAPESFQLVTQL